MLDNAAGAIALTHTYAQDADTPQPTCIDPGGLVAVLRQRIDDGTLHLDVPLHMAACRWGRTIHLRDLDPGLPIDCAYVLVICVCPSELWCIFVATPRVFAVVDGWTTAYVARCTEKSKWQHQEKAYGPYHLTRALRRQMQHNHGGTLNRLLIIAIRAVPRAVRWRVGAEYQLAMSALLWRREL